MKHIFLISLSLGLNVSISYLYTALIFNSLLFAGLPGWQGILSRACVIGFAAFGGWIIHKMDIFCYE